MLTDVPVKKASTQSHCQIYPPSIFLTALVVVSGFAFLSHMRLVHLRSISKRGNASVRSVWSNTLLIVVRRKPDAEASPKEASIDLRAGR